MKENKEFLIKGIIEKEYNMFNNVKGIDGRASCQDDYKTFFIMRYAQHNIFSEESLKSYKLDLEDAKKENRNLISEKYAYMMEITDYEYFYKNLKNKLPDIEQNKKTLISIINCIIEKDTIIFKSKYPNIFKITRPQKSEYTASVSTYLVGELKTLSERTLENYLTDLLFNKFNNKNNIEEIEKMIFKFYGFNNLDIVEENINI